jgi:hypothetical protein
MKKVVLFAFNGKSMSLVHVLLNGLDKEMCAVKALAR